MALLRRGETWTLVFRHQGKQHWWSTQETDRAAANRKAKAYMESVRSAGFDAAVAALTHRKVRMTVRQVADWYKGAPVDVRKDTKTRNIWAFLTLARAIGLEQGDDSNLIGPKPVMEWMAAQPNRETANAILRQARSVVARDCPVKPSGLFVKPLKVTKTLYTPPPMSLVQNVIKVAQELQSSDKGSYLAFCLTYRLGLRASEATHARRSWVLGELFQVRAEPDFPIKNRKERLLPLDQDVREYIEAHGGDEYILPGGANSRKACIARLNHALVSAGWTRRLKAHELRKFFGAQVATQAGVFAAARLLGNTPQVADSTYTALTTMPKFQLMSHEQTSNTSSVPCVQEAANAEALQCGTLQINHVS